MSPFRGSWTASLALGGAALVLRIWHLLSLRALPTFEGYVMDEAYHDTWARSLASGDWLGHEAFFRAPLYPYMLGVVYRLFGTGGLAPRLIQCLLGALAVVIVHRIALRLGSRWSAALSALLAALCWPLIYFDNELLITGLEVLLAAAALLALIKADEAGGRLTGFLAAGVILGLASIARPNMLLMAVPALIWTATGPGASGARRLARSLALVAGLTLPIAPVTVRNAIVGGDLVLISSQGGVNFYIGNNPQSDGTTAIVPGTRPTWEGGYEDTIDIARRAEGRALRPSEVSRYWFRQGLAFWKEEPRAALSLLFRKVTLFFSGVEISNNKDLTFFRSLSPVLRLPLPAAQVLVPLGLTGWIAALAFRPADRRLLWLPAACGAAYAVSIIAFFVTTRYRAPVLPILALGTGLLADQASRLIQEHRWRTLAGTAAAAAVLLWALNVNWYGYRDDPGQGHLSLGLGHQAEGHLPEAIEEFDRSIALGGPFVYEAWRQKGEALAALGRGEESGHALEEALRARPDSTDTLASLLGTAAVAGRLEKARAFALATVPQTPEHRAELHFLLGSIEQAGGRTGEAESDYRTALSARPDHVATLVNLALLLRGTGRLDESLALLQEAERAAPYSAVVHLNLAKHYLFLGRRDEALRHARLAEQSGATLEQEFRQALDK
ncbi:MAG: glycosyltransferase family 39 protein [Candidatus Polarisedimenticolia bacterium]